MITLYLYSSSASFHLAFLQLNLWRMCYQPTTVRLTRKIKRKRSRSRSQDKNLHVLDSPIRTSILLLQVNPQAQVDANFEDMETADRPELRV